MNGLGNLDINNMIPNQIFDGLNSTGGMLDSVSRIAESMAPIVVFLIIGAILVMKKTMITQLLGTLLICSGLLLGFMMYRSARGF